MQMKSSQIIYSEHDYDECFEYKDGSGRVPDGCAVGYEIQDDDLAGTFTKLVLFDDVAYSEHDHKYWNNYELEQDVDRIILP
jgi:hypothetical protein